MKKKYIIIGFCLIVLLIGTGVMASNNYVMLPSPKLSSESTTTTSVRFVSSSITADGVVTAQNQAILNFQTPGKLTYLPFKEGDKVTTGETIAQLDSYALQRQLTAALNNYKITRNNFDQTQDNANTGVLQGAQEYNLQVPNKGGFETSQVIGDIVKRILEQNQATLNNSVINVELANYALQLSTLSSPLNGIITHEDVTVSGLNITPATTFIVADPDTMVFRANVLPEDIYYVAEGSSVTLTVDGLPDKITGTVLKIYPSKVVLPGGQSAYQVDIQSDQLKKLAKLDATGRVSIDTNSQNVALVPAWTVLAGKYIWIDNAGTPKLTEVTAGKIHGSEIEIIKGLSTTDRIIINPKYIPSLKYSMI